MVQQLLLKLKHPVLRTIQALHHEACNDQMRGGYINFDVRVQQGLDEVRVLNRVLRVHQRKLDHHDLNVGPNAREVI